MIGGLLTGIAASPWMRSALRYNAIALVVLLWRHGVNLVRRRGKPQRLDESD